MTTYLENLLRWLMPKGNWGIEGSIEWGQLWVHMYIGATLPLIFLPIVQYSSILCVTGAFLTGLLTPLYRELIIDKHSISDLWANTPKGIDCRSDILSCWLGSLLPCIIIGITCLLKGIL